MNAVDHYKRGQHPPGIADLTIPYKSEKKREKEKGGNIGELLRPSVQSPIWQLAFTQPPAQAILLNAVKLPRDGKCSHTTKC